MGGSYWIDFIDIYNYSDYIICCVNQTRAFDLIDSITMGALNDYRSIDTFSSEVNFISISPSSICSESSCLYYLRSLSVCWESDTIDLLDDSSIFSYYRNLASIKCVLINAYS